MDELVILGKWMGISLDIELVKLAVATLNIAVSVFLFMTLQKINKEKANNERMTAFETSVTNNLKAHSDRILRLETEVSHTLTSEDLAQLHEKVNEANECISTVEGQMKGVVHTVNMIQQFLMERPR